MTYSWLEAAKMLQANSVGARLRFARHLVPHPMDAKLRRGLGIPTGQWADFFLPLEDGRSLHVQDFESGYEAHLDSSQVGCDDLLRAIGSGEALSAVVGFTALGGLVGILLGRSKEATVVGALLGAALGGAAAMALDLKPGAGTKPVSEVNGPEEGTSNQ